jgi:hypothetical protein
MIALDQIDKQAAAVLEGYLVRKDLVRTFSRQFPVPTYNDVRISPELVHEHERMLTGGFYAELSLTYDAVIAQENKATRLGSRP